jgi:hypothetical protein
MVDLIKPGFHRRDVELRCMGYSIYESRSARRVVRGGIESLDYCRQDQRRRRRGASPYWDVNAKIGVSISRDTEGGE